MPVIGAPVARSVTTPVIWPPGSIAALIPDVVAPSVTLTGSALASDAFAL
jgi:hypothetical protein